MTEGNGTSDPDSKTGMPVYVMLPLDIINEKHNVQYGQGSIDEQKAVDLLTSNLVTLKENGVTGVMVDCWWGRVEAEDRGEYDWTGYTTLFKIVCDTGLDLHVVMSFHACGDNVGDRVRIPLPKWVTSIGNQNPDIFYKDGHGNPDYEYLSLGVDNEPVLFSALKKPESPLQVYSNFMVAFRESMKEYFDKKVESGNVKVGSITGIEVGLGPSGELRYPSYRKPEWHPLGIGEFQCYDKYMMKSWKIEAREKGFPIPCGMGPQTAGNYNSKPEQTEFFNKDEKDLTDGRRYVDPYGKAFLSWYSTKLVDHGNRVLQVAKRIFRSKVEIAAKVPGIHWYCNDPSHAAEATAGLFRNSDPSVYKSIDSMLEALKATLIFTCAEMKDDPSNKTDKPEELVEKVLKLAKAGGLFTLACENALEAYDEKSYNQIFKVVTAYEISYFTYMRLSPDLVTGDKLENFKNFMNKMNST